MTIPRIDIIAQNGGDGEHYKYEEVAKKIFLIAQPNYNLTLNHKSYNYMVGEIVKTLVENFPDA